MSKILIAVCDADAAYGRKLGEWITLEKGGQLRGCSFSAPEQFLEFQKACAPDVVLLGAGFWEDAEIIGLAAQAMEGTGSQAIGGKETPAIAGRAMQSMEGEETPAIAGRAMQAMEGKEIPAIAGRAMQAMAGPEDVRESFGETLWLCLQGNIRKENIPESMKMLPMVQKYQPASGIVRDIFSYCQKYREEEPETAGAGRELIGIYAPGQDSWQTPFALTLAQTLSRKERVLYVNFKECAGFSSWLKESYQRDLLDVMYLCLTGEGKNVPDSIRSAVYVLEGVDYIPPSEDSLCLGQVSGQDYTQFVRLLAEKSGYGSIILDFGMMVPGFLELLGLCSKVYVLGGQAGLGSHAMVHFRQMIGRQRNQRLENKLSYLTLPKMEVGRQGEKMQQWIWGELGDYVRGLVGVQIGTD